MNRIDQNQVREFKSLATRVRKHILQSVHHAQGGHCGGPLSAVDVLVALYFHTLRIDPQNPTWEDRDRFILSKGHAAIALYAVMAERGYFPVEELKTFDAIGSRMQAHPEMAMTPGIDMSTGSLGQGLSVGLGMALGARLQKKDFRVYVMIGDGESQEGQIWEAAAMASRYRLDNITAILDYNKVQQFGWQYPEPLLPIESPAAKFAAFGWQPYEIDGHDFEAIVGSLEDAKTIKGKPTIVIANTIKGKGVSFMEGRYQWHARVPDDEELARALKELDELALEELAHGHIQD
jgi:transketolase